MSSVTFLMTDIEGSTRLWEELPEAMAPALEAHDAILRDAVTASGGSVVKTTGDGLLAAFPQTDQALLAALAGQRGLTAHAWGETGALRVRMAVHCGAAQTRDADYYGPTVNRVARLLAIGHGGQILVSGPAAGLVRDDLPVGGQLIDRGEHRLRDLDRPEHVFQLVAADMAHDFPALRSLGSYRTNLPSQLTSFVGRERELADLRALAAVHRLITLIGTGGTGKTRLMLQVGAELLDHHADGVWLTELAPISDPAQLVREVSRCLGVPEVPGQTALESLTDYLRAKSLLLLIDNCEHVIGAAADLAERLLAACPDLAVIATSREALGIPGESVFQVPSLELPTESHHDDRWLAAVSSCEAVRLFVDRAMASLPTFRLTLTNASAVVEICRRLDGIPLALELAAARVTVLSPEEIAAGLGDRFRLLTGGRRTALPRQQTLQALVDWSWDLLTDLDRRLLARLSVFAGGWTLDAAVAVTGPEENGPAAGARMETLDGLTRLVDRSLVVVERGEATRYRMLETIRQYARDRLVATGEAVSMHERHLDHFREFALSAETGLMGPEMIPWLGRVDAEFDNLRAAMDWSFESDVKRGLAVLVALMPYWRSRSFGSEAMERMERAAALAEGLPTAEGQEATARHILIGRVFAATALTNAMWASTPRALHWAKLATEMAEASDDTALKLEAFAALAMASVFGGAGPDMMRSMAEEGGRLAEANEDWWLLSMVQGGLALMTAGMGDMAGAEAHLERATRAAAATRNPFAMSFAALSRGRVAGWAHNLDEARQWFEVGVAGYRDLGDRRFALIARSDFAHALRQGGALDEAEPVYRETLIEWMDTGNRGAIANQLECLAMIGVARGQPQRAVQFFGTAESLREQAGAPMLNHERAEYQPAVDAARRALDPAVFAAEWAAGRGMTSEQAVALALSDPA